jgi:hypothetical protein
MCAGTRTPTLALAGALTFALPIANPRWHSWVTDATPRQEGQYPTAAGIIRRAMEGQCPTAAGKAHYQRLCRPSQTNPLPRIRHHCTSKTHASPLPRLCRPSQASPLPRLCHHFTSETHHHACATTSQAKPTTTPELSRGLPVSLQPNLNLTQGQATQHSRAARCSAGLPSRRPLPDPSRGRLSAH